jgi:hypothetical protein
MKLASVALLLSVVPVSCAGTSPTVEGPSSVHARVPAKCTACHLAPAEHSLAAEKWPAYLKAHRRRLHLTTDEETFLYDFLIGGSPPTAQAP